MKLAHLFAILMNRAPSLGTKGIHIEAQGKIWIHVAHSPAPDSDEQWMSLNSMLGRIQGAADYLEREDWKGKSGRLGKRHMQAKGSFERQLPGFRALRMKVLDKVDVMMGKGELEALPVQARAQFATELLALRISLEKDFIYAVETDQHDYFNQRMDVLNGQMGKIRPAEAAPVFANKNMRSVLKIIQGGRAPS